MAQPYQQFHSPPPTSNTVIAPGPMMHPQAIVTSSPPVMIYHVNTTRNIGITHLVMGCLTVICGIVALIDLPDYWFSASGAGLWTGVIIIICGSLCIASSYQPEMYGKRCAALTFSIFSIILAFFGGIIAYIGFIAMISCYCNYDYSYNNDWNCVYRCKRSTPTMVAAVLMAIMMSVEFILGIVSAVYTGRGCCGGHNTGAVIVQQPGYPAGTIITSSAHPGYQVPFNNPPFSAPSYGTPGYSAPQQNRQEPYAPGYQGAAQTNVTYGADYNPENKNLDVPPPYK